MLFNSDIQTPKIENSSRQKLEQPQNKKFDHIENKYADSERPKAKLEEPKEAEKKCLTEEQKSEIKEKTGWSNEIIDNIKSMKEAEIYIKAELKEAEINGKKCLIRTDINWDQKDNMGRTNKERCEQGLAPINKEGKLIELHHIGQKADSPLAELTSAEHRGNGNDTILHNKDIKSEIDRNEFAKEKNKHWESRAKKG